MSRPVTSPRPSSRDGHPLLEESSRRSGRSSHHDRPSSSRPTANLRRPIIREETSTAIDDAAASQSELSSSIRSRFAMQSQSIINESTRARTDTDRSDESAPTTAQDPETAERGGVEMTTFNTSSDTDQDEDKDETCSISGRSETTVLSRKDLGVFDVAALIINKQIGTGIFTTPGLVLSMTGSKTISLIMWLVGGLWAFLSVIIYVEFGSAFPFNGGELIYLDEVFRKPELLATVLFSVFFIAIPNTDGNSLQFAKHILLAAMPTVTDTTELDKRLLSYVAITILTIVCLIHYFSRNSGLVLNLVFAIFKIVFVIALIVGGCIAVGKPDNGLHDWGRQPVRDKNVLGALVYVIYSYQGWENANYVGGELKVASRDLKLGAFLAVGLVTVLYTLVTMAYCFALKFEDLAGADLAVIVRFVPKAFGESGVLAAKICIALSAFGNLIAVVYTSARVKQQIARQCIIPFYKRISADDPYRKTPTGAIVLHWIFAGAWIIATPNTSQGYGFVIGLFVYGQLVVGFFVAIAFFFIRRSFEAGVTRSSAYTTTKPIWTPVILKNRIAQVICGMMFMGMNLVVMVEGARGGGHPAPKLRPTVVLSLIGLASIIWGIVWLIERYSNHNSSIEIRIIRAGIDHPEGLDKQALDDAKRGGNSRVVIYKTHGKLETVGRSIGRGFRQLKNIVAR